MNYLQLENRNGVVYLKFSLIDFKKITGNFHLEALVFN